PPASTGAFASGSSKQARSDSRSALPRLFAKRGEDAGNTDAPERLVAGSCDAEACQVLTRSLRDDLTRKRHHLSSRLNVVEHDIALRAGRVDVHMSDCAPFNLFPMRIGIP